MASEHIGSSLVIQYQNDGLTPECPESERRIVLTRDVKPANILGDG